MIRKNYLKLLLIIGIVILINSFDILTINENERTSIQIIIGCFMDSGLHSEYLNLRKTILFFLYQCIFVMAFGNLLYEALFYTEEIMYTRGRFNERMYNNTFFRLIAKITLVYSIYFVTHIIIIKNMNGIVIAYVIGWIIFVSYLCVVNFASTFISIKYVLVFVFLLEIICAIMCRTIGNLFLSDRIMILYHELEKSDAIMQIRSLAKVVIAVLGLITLGYLVCKNYWKRKEII